jgi:uncharacterized protein (DUF4415 family)
MKNYEEPLTTQSLVEMSDEEIDYSDIPELDEEFWQNARLVMPETKERITLRVDKEVIDFFRSGGQGYQTRMNAVLRAYVKTQQDKQIKPSRS